MSAIEESRRCVVTGGAGFIGSHLTERLLTLGHSVLVLDDLSTGRLENLAHVADNPRLAFELKDLSAADDLPLLLKDADWVFHLAGLADIVPSIEKPRDYYRANAHGTFVLLEAARQSGVRRFIYAASSTCYGIPEAYPTPENAPLSPQYPYALTKMMGEELVLHWAKVYGLPALSLRMFNVYGPRARTGGTYGAVFGVFLAQKLAGKPLTVVGDGNQTRDFTYVDDVVEAFIAAAQSTISANVYNVGSGYTHSINYLVELLGCEKTHIPKRPGEPDCTFADTAKIRADLGWEAKIDFPTGVSKMLALIENWRNAPIWTPEAIAKATEGWFKFLGDKPHGQDR